MARLLVPLLYKFRVVIAIPSLYINTTSGLVQGIVRATSPNVAQFLGIPFAEQPIGARRWLPPSPKSRDTSVINATNFGHACPQFEADANVAPNLFLTDAPEFNIHPQNYQGEDCLSVNVWTPWNETQNQGETDASLPVIAWIYGGGFYSGGGTVPYQDPSLWVERSGKHIVVGIK